MKYDVPTPNTEATCSPRMLQWMSEILTGTQLKYAVDLACIKGDAINTRRFGFPAWAAFPLIKPFGFGNSPPGKTLFDSIVYGLKKLGANAYYLSVIKPPNTLHAVGIHMSDKDDYWFFDPRRIGWLDFRKHAGKD